MVDIVTQSPGLSSEEIERYITKLKRNHENKKPKYSRYGAVARSPGSSRPLEGPNRMGTSLGLLGPPFVPIASPSSDLCLTRSCLFMAVLHVVEQCANARQLGGEIPLMAIPGVGSVLAFGPQHSAVRIWSSVGRFMLPPFYFKKKGRLVATSGPSLGRKRPGGQR